MRKVLLISSMLLMLFFAEVVEAGKSTSTDKKNFCKNVLGVASKGTQIFLNKEIKFQEQHAKRKSKLDAKHANVDSKKQEVRSKIDNKWSEKLAKLNEKATTEAQKQAVATFKTTVEQALKTKRDVIDQAIISFRMAFDQALLSRQSSMDTSVHNFRVAVDTAGQTAISECNNKTNPKSVKDTYAATVTAARDRFEDELQNDEIKAILSTLINAKKEQIEKANQDFQSAIEDAGITLKTALNP